MMTNTRAPRVVVAGSVGSTRRTLAALLRHRVKLVGVLGLQAERAKNVSGYARLDDLALPEGIPYREFGNINTPQTIAHVRGWSPDILFVVGLSQLVEAEMLAVPRVGCVGFHPTRLPEGRGRAPIAWMILEKRPGAATFFVMQEQADCGPILVQEPFEVQESDYAADVINSMEHAIDRALDRWLPHMIAGDWKPIPQEHSQATYYGRRAPQDGLIEWNQAAEDILRLIRATSRPHPGAFTYLKGKKLIIWRAERERSAAYRGVIGRILRREDHRGWLVQTGKGLLWLEEVAFEVREADFPQLKVGVKLG